VRARRVIVIEPMPPGADANKGRLLSFELEDIFVFPRAALLELSDRLTVLVGKNGAGKSALMEGCQTAAQYATGGAREDVMRRLIYTPVNFRLVFEFEGDKYRFAFTNHPVASGGDEDVDLDAETDVAEPEWTEECRRTDTNALIWRVENGGATIGNSTIRLQPGTGLLRLAPPETLPRHPLVSWLRRTLLSVRLVQAGVPRTTTERQMSVVQRDAETGWFPVGANRIDALTAVLVNWQERDPALASQPFTTAAHRRARNVDPPRPPAEAPRRNRHLLGGSADGPVHALSTSGDERAGGRAPLGHEDGREYERRQTQCGTGRARRRVPGRWDARRFCFWRRRRGVAMAGLGGHS
jgi:hypothetical protein